jgi:hypothetical protein
MPPSDDAFTDPTAGGDRDGFFGWYHHAVALAYAVSATVSTWSSTPLARSAALFVGSLLLAYVVVAVLTVVARRVVPAWL